MSDPRASIQRAVTAPPPRIAASAAPVLDAVKAETAAQIGKPHGRMRCVNLSLPVDAAVALRRATADRASTLGEVLIDIVRSVQVPTAGRAEGRSPCIRRATPTANVYVLLTQSEAGELGSLASQARRTVSDFAGVAIAAALV